MDDWHLLNEYATRNSEAAFRTLVDRYAGMVYHAALRQVGSSHAAEEVAQAVFIALAQKAGRISRQTVLYGWLFRATRFAVLRLVRDENCRRRYEQQAMTSQSNIASAEADSVWEQISPHLDDALERLSRADREVVMIRFFGNKTHRQVAQELGISEDTAKKRLSRALERLRAGFIRRGLVVPAVALLTALSAHGAAVAPAGLASSIAAAAIAKSAAGTASAFSLAKGILKLMAWAKAKTTAAFGAGILLAAAGAATVALNAATPSIDDLVSRLARQSGKKIVWDKHLTLPAAPDVENMTLEQALDKLAIQANAYWTIDYAVYDSDESLRKLLDVLHDGAELETGGWTNLSSMPLEPHISVMPYDPHGRMRTFIRIPKDHPRDQVTMLVMLGPEASAEFTQAPDQGGPRQVILTGPPPDSGASKIIKQAMADGVVEGVLAPERLLAVTRLVPAMNPATPVPATPEDAARLAKAAHARWTTIYTLRKSPLDGAGIKLIHTGMESMYGPPNLPSNPGNMVGSLQSNRFNLSPEDRAAHQRAVEALKKNQ